MNPEKKDLVDNNSPGGPPFFTLNLSAYFLHCIQMYLSTNNLYTSKQSSYIDTDRPFFKKEPDVGLMGK